MLILRSLVCALFAALGISGFAADIIVESRAEGKNYSGYSEPVGSWLDSNDPPATAKSSADGLTPQGQVGSRKTSTSAELTSAATGVLSSARFTPDIATGGDYHVYITFPRAGNAASLTVAVKHAEGEEKKTINQDGWGAIDTANGNKWIKIGEFPFVPGKTQYAELQVTKETTVPDKRNPAQAFADAVRFTTEPLPETAPATPVVAAKPAVAGATPIATAIGGASNAPDAVSAFTPPAVKQPAAVAASAPPSNAPLQWATDLAAGRDTAGKAGKKVFVFFFSPKSIRSADYEKQVLNDPAVKGVIVAGFVPVKINMDMEIELAGQLQVFRAGSISVYDAATGNGLDRIGDAPGVDELVKRLEAVR